MLEWFPLKRRNAGISQSVVQITTMSNVILGGGISGLAAAFYLLKSGKNGIKLYEASHRLGGWIRSTKQRNGTIFEHGPRTLRCRGKAGENALQLVDEIGLSSSIIPIHKTSEAGKNRMIYFNNQLILLPNSWTALFKIDPPIIRPFIYGLWNDIVTPKKSTDDESVHDFVTRRFGKDYADILLSAMVCGIFAGDAKEISVKALLNDLFQKEQQFGGICRSFIHKMSSMQWKVKNETKNAVRNTQTKMWTAWSLVNGLETLPNQLKNYLQPKNVEILLKRRCTNIDFKNGKALITCERNLETADHIYSTLPSKDLAEILGNEHSFLKTELSSIPFVTVGVVNLEYKGDILDKKGFGLLVPPSQKLPILGIIFDSCIAHQEGKTILTVMMGGRWFDHYFGPNPQDKLLLKVAEDHIREILKIKEKPVSTMVSVLKDCIPQYVVGHSKRVERIREYIKNHNLPLTLIGNSFDGIGVNDAILSAKTGVEKVLGNIQ